jgi:hypothetical protein
MARESDSEVFRPIALEYRDGMDPRPHCVLRLGTDADVRTRRRRVTYCNDVLKDVPGAHSFRWCPSAEAAKLWLGTQEDA